MGYALECYLLAHTDLQHLVGSRREDLFHLIVESEQDIFAANPRVPWRGALRELITGERGRVLSKREVFGEFGHWDIATDEESIAFVALVRARGARLGELIHNTRAGEKFRQIFVPEFAPSPFAHTALLPRLLSNPLFGVTRDLYPCWGGLSHAELTQLLDRDMPAAWPADMDQHQWLHQLNEFVEQCVDEGTDLVTLYL